MKFKEVIDAIFRDKNKMPFIELNAVPLPLEAIISHEIGLYCPIYSPFMEVLSHA